MVDIYKWLFGDRGKAAVGDADDAEQTQKQPSNLTPYLEAIAKTEQQIIAINTEEHAPQNRRASRLGGYPWWPADKPYPKDATGQPLYLLIQINFAETPALPPFPHQGILQIFIAAGDLYGCNLEDLRNSDGFDCVYHTDLDQKVLTDFEFLPDESTLEYGYLPLDEAFKARALSFELDKMPIDPSDYRLKNVLPEIAADEDLSQSYWDYVDKPAIRLGGYPTFTQDDPRMYPKGADLGDFTLLTIDTTDGIMWGDSGAAQFFMHEDDLKRRDFSRVIYNWDCC